ncbi:MAG TPA: hypothetical protein VLX92_18055 [Kofleriaceae bacterium]|nr:hypothetical protein [Kofleriaceae bacterium]
MHDAVPQLVARRRDPRAARLASSPRRASILEGPTTEQLQHVASRARSGRKRIGVAEIEPVTDPFCEGHTHKRGKQFAPGQLAHGAYRSVAPSFRPETRHAPATAVHCSSSVARPCGPASHPVIVAMPRDIEPPSMWYATSEPNTGFFAIAANASWLSLVCVIGASRAYAAASRFATTSSAAR